MKKLTIEIVLQDTEEIETQNIIAIHDFFNAYFVKNKGICHRIEPIIDYKEMFGFLKDYVEDLKRE